MAECQIIFPHVDIRSQMQSFANKHSAMASMLQETYGVKIKRMPAKVTDLDYPMQLPTLIRELTGPFLNHVQFVIGKIVQCKRPVAGRDAAYMLQLVLAIRRMFAVWSACRYHMYTSKPQQGDPHNMPPMARLHMLLHPDVHFKTLAFCNTTEPLYDLRERFACRDTIPVTSTDGSGVLLDIDPCYMLRWTGLDFVFPLSCIPLRGSYKKIDVLLPLNVMSPDLIKVLMRSGRLTSTYVTLNQSAAVRVAISMDVAMSLWRRGPTERETSLPVPSVPDLYDGRDSRTPLALKDYFEAAVVMVNLPGDKTIEEFNGVLVSFVPTVYGIVILPGDSFPIPQVRPPAQGLFRSNIRKTQTLLKSLRPDTESVASTTQEVERRIERQIRAYKKLATSRRLPTQA